MNSTPNPGDAPERTLRLTLLNRLDALEQALDQTEDFLLAADAPQRLVYRIRLVAEEMITNTIKYGFDDDAEHRIGLVLRLGPPAVLCIDDDGHPFDPTREAPAVDPEADLEDRPIGGLGLHMVRTSTASLHYRRANGLNRLEIVFAE